MTVILSIETATLGGSVFLGRGKSPLATRKGDAKVSQSNSLLHDINTSLDEAGLSLQDVDFLACASGPGSFTGLRIGIATLKALAATLERPCAGIPTLQAVAHGAGASSATLSLLPAGRGEVYAQMFSVSEDERIKELDTAAHLSPQKLVEKYAAFTDLIWAGEGSHQQRQFLRNYAQQVGIAFADETTDLPHQGQKLLRNGWRLAARETNLAQHVAALALQLFEAGEIQSPDSVRAIYVRPSDAELKEKCR
jgi:tRNA threonylcarbamoyladenosine biosynthesis protein TsaB